MWAGAAEKLKWVNRTLYCPYPCTGDTISHNNPTTALIYICVCVCVCVFTALYSRWNAPPCCSVSKVLLTYIQVQQSNFYVEWANRFARPQAQGLHCSQYCHIDIDIGHSRHLFCGTRGGCCSLMRQTKHEADKSSTCPSDFENAVSFASSTPPQYVLPV